MPKTVIKVEDLSKQYRLGVVGTGTLSHDLNRWWARLRGQDDPTLSVTESNDRAHVGHSEFVWALNDINFEVRQGEVLGIIGRNGAGKSTLLKILSRVTAPTTGQVKVKGRIASLLEVGTGFHPELTGRENIYLNGAIMGMTRREVSTKLDEIVDFSGCERFIDTPVKRYSSGMTVRLGFAVAAHLEPEILVVDEVLAVGDAEFQKKCLGKMKDVAGHGRTVLFVSHNMAAVRSMCTRGILLNEGGLEIEGDTGMVVDHYSTTVFDGNARSCKVEKRHRRADESRDLEFKEIEVLDDGRRLQTDTPVTVGITIAGNKRQQDCRIAGTISMTDGTPVGSFFSPPNLSVDAGEIAEIEMTIPNHNLSVGTYFLSLSVGKGSVEAGNINFDRVFEVIFFSIEAGHEGSQVVKWDPSWGATSLVGEMKVTSRRSSTDGPMNSDGSRDRKAQLHT